jgi:hypothetical protein
MGFVYELTQRASEAEWGCEAALLAMQSVGGC